MKMLTILLKLIDLKKLIIPLVVVISIAVGVFGSYEYGKLTEQKAEVVKTQTTYIKTRTKIDEAIQHKRPADASAALDRLRARQSK